MSAANIPNCVNELVPNIAVGSIDDFIEEIAQIKQAPIDVYRLELQKMITQVQPIFFQSYDSLSSNVLLKIVSLTENYFRNILAGCILICPISKKNASNQTVNLGSIVWHKKEKVLRSAFENNSFANSDEIKKACKSFLSYKIPDNGIVDSMLKEYDKICNLRHAIVHADSLVAGKNANQLNIPNNDKEIKVKLDYNNFQVIANVCLSLVSNFNNELFKQMCDRWAIAWRRDYNVDSTNENQYFKYIWKLFYSDFDSQNGTISQVKKMRECLKEIKILYRIV